MEKLELLIEKDSGNFDLRCSGWCHNNELRCSGWCHSNETSKYTSELPKTDYFI